jgi:hypothetical protein
MSRRFVQLVVIARRLVTRVPARSGAGRRRVSVRRQVGEELSQFSFRLAFMIDLVYVGVGALGGAALGHSAVDSAATLRVGQPRCVADSIVAAARTDSALGRGQIRVQSPEVESDPIPWLIR